jgi:hypothetical protein
MSFYDAIRVGASGAADFEVERSLRFNDDDTAYLSRTPSSAGNRKTYTISAWVKIGNLGTTRPIFNRYTGNSDAGFLGLYVNSDDFIYFTGWSTVYLKSNRLYRDSSAWSHIVLAVDTTQSTSTDRIKLYFNGELQSTATYNAPSQDADLVINEAVEHRIGNYHNVYFDGYMAEVNFIDGSQLTPSYFGETDVLTGQWNPKKYTGGYGTTGFYLNFLDNSGTTATTLGKDSSGNGNNFTPNNFSVSAGAGNDSLEDTPTNNFPTLNPLYNPVNTTFGEGNLLMRGGDNFAASTFLLPKSGKWYVEFSKYGNGALQSISVTRANTAMTNYAGYLGLADNVEYVSNGELGNRSRGSTSDATAWTSDADIVVAAAVDMDNGAVYFARANTWQNSGDPTSGSSKTGAIATDLLTDNNGDHVIAVHGYNGNNSYGMYANFGQQPLTYTPPTGYKVLSSANLPDPTILLPNKYFDTFLYTATGNAMSFSGLNFQPDWIWQKSRNSTGSSNVHYTMDAVRGGDKGLVINSNNAEFSGADITFTSNGYDMGASTGGQGNGASNTYVSWNWNAGGSTVTNNDGSISSQVRANTTAGFSIVGYTGTGSAATIGHGLGVAPKWLVVKLRSGSQDWFVNNGMILNDLGKYYKLNSSGSSNVSDTNVFPNTAPTSTVFSVGTDSAVNASGSTYVAYVFSEVEGYSKFVAYTGNGSTDGTFVYTGFAPAFMIQRKETDTNWHMMDSTRDPLNPNTLGIDPNLSSAEADDSNLAIDFLSNGFKLRTSHSTANGSGTKYILLAFAESPFKNSRAR